MVMDSRSRSLGSGGVLGTTEIRERLGKGEIFRNGTWDPECIQEASYDLRVADDFLLVGGKPYPEGRKYDQNYIEIKSGEIALLSTMEHFTLPDDLVGQIGIRFSFTRQGLVPLFGAQVNPGYGADHPDERLYLVVCNLKLDPITIKPRESVCNITFHQVRGTTEQKPHDYVKPRIENQFFRTEPQKQIGFFTSLQAYSEQKAGQVIAERLENRMSKLENELSRLDTKTGAIERGLSQIVLFGVVLVAASIFGVVIAALLALLFNTELVAAASLSLRSWLVPGGLVLIFLALIALAGLFFFAMLRLLPKNKEGKAPSAATTDTSQKSR